MTSKEIVEAAEEYANKRFSSKDLEMYQLSGRQVNRIIETTFASGVEFSDKHWQEKTRWKSLEKEPPTEYEYDKMYLLRTEAGNPYLVPLPYISCIKEYIDYGFIEWKEIE